MLLDLFIQMKHFKTIQSTVIHMYGISYLNKGKKKTDIEDITQYLKKETYTCTLNP